MAVFPKISKIVADASDPRIALQHAIVTEEGFLIATDAHGLVVFDIKFWFTQSWENAIGKAIHLSVLKELEKASVKEIEFTPDGIKVTTKNGSFVYQYSASLITDEESNWQGWYHLAGTSEDKDTNYFRFPVWKNVIPDFEQTASFPRFGLDVELLMNVTKALTLDRVNMELKFAKNSSLDGDQDYPRKAILVQPAGRVMDECRSYGIIMPRMLSK